MKKLSILNFDKGDGKINLLFFIICILIISLSVIICAGSNISTSDCSATIINFTSDHGIDLDNDLVHEFLGIDVVINIIVPGEYSLMGDLNDCSNNEIVWSIDHCNCTKGPCLMHLNFDGEAIRNHRINGPYHLDNVVLFSGSSDTFMSNCDYRSKAYTTLAYNYSDFGK